jgi:RNA polymerase sigma factor (sigma-70 family)
VTEKPTPAARAEGQVTALYQAHATGLVRLAMLMLGGDQAAAEDVVQDAFLGLYRRWDKLSDPERAIVYARSSVLNGCRDVLRKRSRKIPAALLDPDVESAEARAVLSEEHSEVLTALRRWSGWLVPLTAAAAVIAVAATLVVVRGSSGVGSASRSTPAAASSSSTGASDSIPPYYVTLNSVKGTATWDAVLGDTATGKPLATFKPPSNGNGSWGIANSATDNTFVLYAGATVPR